MYSIYSSESEQVPESMLSEPLCAYELVMTAGAMGKVEVELQGCSALLEMQFLCSIIPIHLLSHQHLSTPPGISHGY